MIHPCLEQCFIRFPVSILKNGKAFRLMSTMLWQLYDPAFFISRFNNQHDAESIINLQHKRSTTKDKHFNFCCDTKSRLVEATHKRKKALCVGAWKKNICDVVPWKNVWRLHGWQSDKVIVWAPLWWSTISTHICLDFLPLIVVSLLVSRCRATSPRMQCLHCNKNLCVEKLKWNSNCWSCRDEPSQLFCGAVWHIKQFFCIWLRAYMNDNIIIIIITSVLSGSQSMQAGLPHKR